MHIEVLVEDSSGAMLIETVLPRVIGRHGEPHTWRVHAYKGIGHIPGPPSRPGQTSLARSTAQAAPRLRANPRHRSAADRTRQRRARLSRLSGRPAGIAADMSAGAAHADSAGHRRDGGMAPWRPESTACGVPKSEEGCPGPVSSRRDLRNLGTVGGCDMARGTLGDPDCRLAASRSGEARMGTADFSPHERGEQCFGKLLQVPRRTQARARPGRGWPQTCMFMISL